MAIIAKAKEALGIVKGIADVVGDAADLIGLSEIRGLKNAISGVAGHAIKVGVGKKGTLLEFEAARNQLTQPEQDALDEILDKIPMAKQRDHFKIHAVLTGPEIADTVAFLKRIAAKPSADEVVADLKRDHYLDPLKHAGSGVGKKIAKAATVTKDVVVDATKKVDREVKGTGVQKWAQKLSKDAKTWSGI